MNGLGGDDEDMDMGGEVWLYVLDASIIYTFLLRLMLFCGSYISLFLEEIPSSP